MPMAIDKLFSPHMLAYSTCTMEEARKHKTVVTAIVSLYARLI